MHIVMSNPIQPDRKMNRHSPLKSWGGAGYILLLCLACHWMLLLNDGFFWDDNLYYGLIQGRHYEEFSTFILETGLPINILFFRGLDLLVGIANHRWVSFVTIFLSAILLNDLFKRYAGEFKSLSLVFTTLYLTFFPFKSTVLLCTTVYQVMLLFFILAVYIRVRYGADDATRVRVLALLAFSVLSFISFNTASILAIYYFYLAFDYFYSADFARAAWSPQNIWNYVRGNFWILILPVVYWVIKISIFPTHGMYATYNKINFDWHRVLTLEWYSFLGIFKSGALHNVATRAPVVLAFLVLLFLFLMAFPRIINWWSLPMPGTGMKRGLALGWSIAFLIISALPYALVGMSGRFQGTESRHYLLFTISLPIFIFITLIIYLERIGKILEIKAVEIISRPIVLCAALVGLISSNNAYMDYQAIAVKQWAIVANLKEKQELRRYSSFWVDDQVGDFSRNGFDWYDATHQNWYEWVAIFTKAWGGQKWYANNMDEPRPLHFKMLRYGAADINPDGEVCVIKVKNTSSSGRSGVVWKYWGLKYFGTEGQLRKFLLSIVAIEICQPGVE